MMCFRADRSIGFVAALAVGACWALAQWRVNPQVGRVSNRVGGELYGNTGSVRYAAYQTTVLPSEARYATWRSGALPSEVRMQAAAVGPLAPSGAIAYVPGPSPVQQAMKTPQPQLYNPAYGIQNRRLDAQLRPQAGYSGSIRYADAGGRIDPTSVPVPPVAASSAKPLSTGQLPSAELSTGPLPTGQISGRVSGQVSGSGGPGTPGGLFLSQSPVNLGSMRYESLSKP
jgi:hypothetical protein